MKNTSAIALAIASVIGPTAFAGIDVSKLPPAAPKKGVTYATDIKPLLEASSCIRCHGPERPKGGLRLDSLDGVLKGSKEGPVVVKGKSTESQMVISVSQLDPESAMPPKPKPGRGGPRGPGGSGWQGGEHGTNAPAGEPGQHSGGPGGPGRNFPPAKPLTPEQVGLVRAWIDQGAK